jgi:hypothetical protein
VALSGDGRVSAFSSFAPNILPGASGSILHVYVRACDVASPSVYCKPKQPVGGCTAHMTFQGAPSATAGSGFLVSAGNVNAQTTGLILYSTSGTWGSTLTEGFLCVRPPIKRMPAASSGGSTGCTGSLATDFNTWISSGADPQLVAGQAVCAQAWFRDLGGAGQLSDALAFLIAP